MKILVCGGRDYSDHEEVANVLDGYCYSVPAMSVAIIHGGARGADSLAGRYAQENGICEIVVKANWDVHGKSAGPIRNQWMLDYCNPNIVVAFPGGAGTADMVRRARKAGVEVLEVP